MVRSLRAAFGASLLLLVVGCGDDTPSGPDGGGGTPTLTVSTPHLTLLPGDSFDLSLAAGEPAGVTWRVAEGAPVAAVTATGRVRAMTPGLARIVVESGALADSVDVAVPRLGVLTNGARHFCALTVGGGARCYGNEQSGELGDGPTGTPTPNVVAGGHTFLAISAGRDHTCAIRTDGVAMCWGGNEYGQVGDGTRTTSLVGVPEPVAVAGPQRYVAIATGESHSCALATDGAVYCWGRNDLGQLGSETAVDCPFGALVQRCQPTPAPVAGARTYRSLTAGANFTCAVDDANRGWCWGAGDWYARGDGDDSPVFEPSPVGGIARYSLIEAGALHACAITPRAETYCWGLGGSGQNGGNGLRTQPDIVAGMRPLAMVSASEDHACGVGFDGSAVCWGSNAGGALGSGSASTPGGATPVAVTGGHAFATIAAGRFRTCAVRRDGALYCWGEVFAGGSTATPIAVAAGTEFQR